MNCNPLASLRPPVALGWSRPFLQLSRSDGAGNWAHSNVWAGKHLDATYDLLGANPIRGVLGTTPALHFHLADPLGTRRVQTDALGRVEENCQSLPFGDALTCTQPSGAPTTADDSTEHHFTGKERYS